MLRSSKVYCTCTMYMYNKSCSFMPISYEENISFIKYTISKSVKQLPVFSSHFKPEAIWTLYYEV
uniref:Uncharacterized protein n=1 Tax=Amphimedon queenslandica TaxID=400682 RepID=A0A1X7UDE4_AMPQE